MDSLPSAPAVRTDEERARANDRYPGKRDDFMSSRPDRAGPPREDLPLPTQAPYTAFVGNLAFDLTESELEEFFAGIKTVSVKIIKDREEKPKGFGYVEFADLEGLKAALALTGTGFSGRTIRVSVAEPPKERGGFGGGFDDDAKFASPWRRDGPLPDLPSSDSRDVSRRRFDGPPPSDAISGVSEGVNDWRSSQPSRRPAAIPEPEVPSFKRRGSGFATPEGQASVADKEENWTIGSKFKASAGADEGSKYGGFRGRGDMGPPKDTSPPAGGDSDWRSAARPRPTARNSTSPNSSTPPTPQLSRRKLELLPRSASTSASPSPLSSPKMAPATPSARSNPFGSAKPVDVSSREKEVSERIEKERESIRVPHPMSRTSSRAASERGHGRTPPTSTIGSTPGTPTSPKFTNQAAVRPSISFADAAAAKTAEEEAQDSKVEEGV
ncbi:hypothetical protein PLICRDRAFT_39716 [Plicaturopsis crispa FD-325 SS-3]|nr:hypothetical protein PLICRDRAFT_39716 [Plicaturopsis crispa FD-325 SS-3]